MTSLQELQRPIQGLQEQLNHANEQIQEQQTQRTNGATSYEQLNRRLHDTFSKTQKPTKNMPDKFSGSGSIVSSTTNMENYLKN